MNYPVWNLDFFGGGLLIALMAVFHVYISHFAVGGGLFLVLTEIKGYREKNQGIIEYTRKHAKFFLLVTMVAGSMTGVGIWFTIALLNPGATSLLIHNFVFGWAIEWVFFLIEIISLFIYAYTFGRMDRRTHLIMGWIYFGAAWMSLFIINGIIDCMLTPGAWVTTRNFWDGFFNPTFWPALFFRTFLALMIAGLFGLLTATRVKDKSLRPRLVRWCALYLLVPFIALLGSAWWYRAALPPELRDLIFQTMPELKPFITGFVWISPILMAGGLLLAIGLPRSLSFPLAVVLLIVGQLYMGTFEFIREGGRRPYIIRDVMYSNSIMKGDFDTVRQQGVLASARWSREKRITPDNLFQTGRELYSLLCLSCHSIGGPLNDIKKATATFTPWGLENMIGSIDRFHPWMPPFPGTRLEQKALAAYIATTLNGRFDPADVTIDLVDEPEPLPFDPDQDEYILLAWPEMGMRAVTDADRTWIMLPPGSPLRALLIKRGELPEVITDGVRLDYAVDRGFTDPTGQRISGQMEPEDTGFNAGPLPVLPYPAQGGYMPYPGVTVTARSDDGAILATTRTVLPVATEMGCNRCHGGRWRVQGRAGLSTRTAENILAVHDRLSGTRLARQARAGTPVLCQNCHADSRIDRLGQPGVLNLSASMHGFHANFLAPQGADACVACHPASDTGATRAFRGIHHSLDLKCTNCHGTLSDHAISLLKAEQEAGKKRATELMKDLVPEMADTADEINPRLPWINQPDCLNCHEEFQPPEDDVTFNEWTTDELGLYRNRTDESGQIPCAACHGAPHALYPAANPYGVSLDNSQLQRYQDSPLPMGSNRGCAVCHTVDMEDEMHHPNLLRAFRNN